jgi:hypothetical protein
MNCPKCCTDKHVKLIGISYTYQYRIKWQRYRCNNEDCKYSFREWNAETGLCDGPERTGYLVFACVAPIEQQTDVAVQRLMEIKNECLRYGNTNECAAS